jgi:hypothetical protein
LLESRLEYHAEELKDDVSRRVERIESRFDRAMKSISPSEDAPDSANVIEFLSEPANLHHLPATAAIDALNELNDTLRLTRVHLEALGASVAKMRRAVG